MNTYSDWATHFYVGQVKNHEKILEAFLPFLDKDEYFSEPWIYSHCKSSCQNPKNLELPWDVFYSSIKDNVSEYLENLRPSCQYRISSNEAWVNIYEQHGFQEIHDHAFPNRAFACSYILEFPEGSGPLVFENTNFPIIQSTGINRIFDAFNYEKFIPNLSPGTLVIFPSWIKHYVLPNRSTDRRTTISANFAVEGFYK